MPEPLTVAQIKILTHALGISYLAQESYRNHYCANSNPDLDALVAAGMMTLATPGSTDYPCYHVTEAGERAARLALTPPGPLQGWWKPSTARAWHWVDIEKPLPAETRGPGSACNQWDYLKQELTEYEDSGAACTKCFAAYCSWVTKQGRAS